MRRSPKKVPRKVITWKTDRERIGTYTRYARMCGGSRSSFFELGCDLLVEVVEQWQAKGIKKKELQAMIEDIRERANASEK